MLFQVFLQGVTINFTVSELNYSTKIKIHVFQHFCYMLLFQIWISMGFLCFFSTPFKKIIIFHNQRYYIDHEK